MRFVRQPARRGITDRSIRLRDAVAPLGVRQFRLHFAARLLSWTGSAVAPIALAFATLHLGGGARSLGLVLAAGMGPQIVLLLVGGVVADRWSRARVMVWTNVVSAVAEGLAALLLWFGSATVWHLVVMSAVCGAASAFFTPAAAGVVVEVVPKPWRHSANALLKIGQNTVKVAGPALGGVLVAAVGPAWVIGWDAATFAAAAFLCSRIDLNTARVKVRIGFLADLREGWVDFRSRRWLWVMVVQASVVVPVWLVGYQLLGPVYGLEVLGGAAPWGWVVSGFTAGLVAGAALALLWKPRLVGVVVCLGTGSLGLPLAAMAATAPLLYHGRRHGGGRYGVGGQHDLVGLSGPGTGSGSEVEPDDVVLDAGADPPGPGRLPDRRSAVAAPWAAADSRRRGRGDRGSCGRAARHRSGAAADAVRRGGSGCGDGGQVVRAGDLHGPREVPERPVARRRVPLRLIGARREPPLLGEVSGDPGSVQVGDGVPGVGRLCARVHLERGRHGRRRGHWVTEEAAWLLPTWRATRPRRRPSGRSGP